MNKYAAKSILAEATLRRQRVLVVERDHHAVRDALEEFERVIAERSWVAAKVRRSNGAESIQLPDGGRVMFATPRGNRMRGLSVDVVFIDNDAHRVLGEDAAGYDRFREDVALCLNARGGEVVHS